MTKAKVLLILAFIVVCAAGVVVGTAVDRQVRPIQPHGPFDKLHLSPEQEAQVKAAWEPVAQQRAQMFHKRHEIDDHRWDAIQKLFTKEQKEQFDQIERDYHRQTREQEDQLSTAVAAATENMKTILTPEQFKAWDQMRKDHGFGHEMRSPGMGPGMGPPGMGSPGLGLPHGHRDHRHSSTRPTTDPTTDPV